MAKTILSNLDGCVNVERGDLITLHNLLQKTSSLGRILFEHKLIKLDEENCSPYCLWTFVDCMMMSSLLLQTTLLKAKLLTYDGSDKNTAFQELITEAHRRLDSLLQAGNEAQQGDSDE